MSTADDVVDRAKEVIAQDMGIGDGSHTANRLAAANLLRQSERQFGNEPRGCPTPGACSCPASAPADATAWLIEFSEKVSRTPAYYGHTGEGLGETTDSLKAVRFARREDAQAIINDIGWNEARPVEHMWADSKCCNDLSPEECAQVPDRHCDGLKPASLLPADDVVEAAKELIAKHLIIFGADSYGQKTRQIGYQDAAPIAKDLAAANLLRQSSPVEAAAMREACAKLCDERAAQNKASYIRALKTFSDGFASECRASQEELEALAITIRALPIPESPTDAAVKALVELAKKLQGLGEDCAKAAKVYADKVQTDGDAPIFREKYRSRSDAFIEAAGYVDSIKATLAANGVKR